MGGLRRVTRLFRASLPASSSSSASSSSTLPRRFLVLRKIPFERIRQCSGTFLTYAEFLLVTRKNRLGEQGWVDGGATWRFCDVFVRGLLQKNSLVRGTDMGELWLVGVGKHCCCGEGCREMCNLYVGDTLFYVIGCDDLGFVILLEEVGVIERWLGRVLEGLCRWRLASAGGCWLPAASRRKCRCQISVPREHPAPSI